MPSELSTKLMNAYMTGTEEDIASVKAEVDAYQKARLTPKKENTVKINTVLNDPSSSAINVYEFLNRGLAQDWWEWEPETIEQVLFIRYGVALNDVNRDKIMSIRHLCRSDRPFHDWFEFNQIALAFSGMVADFEMVRKPTPGMILSAVKAMNYIRPDRESFFGDDVLKYMSIALFDEGIYIPPPSVLLLTKKQMAELVSDEMKASWMDILKKYNDIVTGKNTGVSESQVDIQARRLVNAEAAALTYSE